MDFILLPFPLQPGEYGASTRHLLMTIHYNRNRFLLIPWYESFRPEEDVYVGRRKDTTLTMDYYFASKAQLRLQLNNFTPASTADSFYTLPFNSFVGMNRER